MNKKKILTIIGTRPEIIRLSRILPKLDKYADHRILHTGQNYDPSLNSIFFKELKIRKPNTVINSKSYSFAGQLGKIINGVESYINDFKPDRVLILGDTNSCLSAIVCERMGIPVYHMEAGNRCYDLSVPEEKNRKIIDSISTINMPYTSQSRENLLREGLPNNKIIVTGNPINEVLDYYIDDIDGSDILDKLHLWPKDYIVATAHRAENVDSDERLRNIIDSFYEIANDYRVVFSCHPRTKQRLDNLNISIDTNKIKIIDPLGFFDFVKLEKNSIAAITDSGTVQEEMCLFRIPTITIRDTTERPETVWCGSNVVTGLKKENIIAGYHMLKSWDTKWRIPEYYTIHNVSDVVVNVLLSGE